MYYEFIPNDLKSDSPASLATAVPKRDPCQKTLSPRSAVDPDSGIEEGVDESQSVYHDLDSWGSLEVLTTEDVVLIVSGLCVALVGASYVFFAEAIRFAWQNRQHVTVRNVKRVGWVAGVVLSLAYFIGYTAWGRGD